MQIQALRRFRNGNGRLKLSNAESKKSQDKVSKALAISTFRFDSERLTHGESVSDVSPTA